MPPYSSGSADHLPDLSVRGENAAGGVRPADVPQLAIADHAYRDIPQVFGDMLAPAGCRTRTDWRRHGRDVRKGAAKAAVKLTLHPSPRQGGRPRYNPEEEAQREWLARRGLDLDRLDAGRRRELDTVRRQAREEWKVMVAAFRAEVADQTVRTLTDPQYDTLQLLYRAGCVTESGLYPAGACNEFDLDSLKPARAWDVLFTDFYKLGSHPSEFIIKSRDADGAWQSQTVGTGKVCRRWDPAGHRKGVIHLGVKAGERTIFLAIDLDRHSGRLSAADHLRLVMAVWDHVVRLYSHMAPLIEVNPDNGSAKVFLHFEYPTPAGEAQAVIDQLRAERPELERVEIYPSLSGPGRKCSQVFLPVRLDKLSIADRVIPKVEAVCYDPGRRQRKYLAYDAAYLLKWLADPGRRLADRGLVLDTIRAAAANLPDAPDAGEPDEPHPARPPSARVAARQKAGDLPDWKNCTAARLVGFLSGDWRPPDDTLDELTVVLLRVLYHMGRAQDDAAAWVEAAVLGLPDLSFSDRLSSRPGEWARNLRQSASTVWNGNGGQPRPEESTRKITEMLAAWRARGFNLTDRTTWDKATAKAVATPRPILWTPRLEEVLGRFAVVLKTKDVTLARRVFEVVASHVDGRKQLALSYFRVLMKDAGVPGGKDKAKAARDFLKAEGVLILFRRSFRDPVARTSRGDLYYLGAAVRFAAVAGEPAAGPALLFIPPPHTPGSIYRSSPAEGEELADNLLLLKRQLAARRWYDIWLRDAARQTKAVA